MQTIGPNCKKEIIGIRPGEKIHEEMITDSDSFSTVDLGDNYAILPTDGLIEMKYDEEGIKYKKVSQGYAYNSGTNPNFLTVQQIRSLIREHIDKNFQPL